jgi:hypothetical protein
MRLAYAAEVRNRDSKGATVVVPKSAISGVDDGVSNRLHFSNRREPRAYLEKYGFGRRIG